MAGILDILRAAVPAAATARSGYLQGQEYRKNEDEKDAERAREVARQEKMDAEEQRRYQTSLGRQSGLDQQQTLMNQTRRALEEAQAKEAGDRGAYYRGGGSAGARVRGSGPKGELTPKDRATYIRTKSMTHYNPDTGMMEPGMSAQDAAAEFDSIVASKPASAPSAGGGSGMAGMRSRGSTMGVTPAASTPQAARPDTARKTIGASGPVAQTRAAITPGGATATAAPTTRLDSIRKRYQLESAPQE